jgi:hypothetical protein
MKEAKIMNEGIVAAIIAIVGSLGVLLIVCLTSVIPILIIGGIFWFIFNQRKKARAEKQASQAWPSTKGKIVTSRVELSSGRDMATVFAKIVYEYQLSGRTYQFDQVHSGDEFFAQATREETYDLVDRYPVGREVTVYYNPDNPADAALEV